MKTAALHKPPWPLESVFIDTLGNTFEVVQTIFGNPHHGFSYTITCSNGWTIKRQGDLYRQSAIGFVPLGSDTLIVESVEDMDQFVQNGHLKITHYNSI